MLPLSVSAPPYGGCADNWRSGGSPLISVGRSDIASRSGRRAEARACETTRTIAMRLRDVLPDPFEVMLYVQRATIAREGLGSLAGMEFGGR